MNTTTAPVNQSARNPTVAIAVGRVWSPSEAAANPPEVVPRAPAKWAQRVPAGGVNRVPTAFRPDGKLPDDDDDVIAAGAHIRCPACQWQPDRKSRWFCMSMGAPENFSAGCGHGWNTFDTRGVCPGCLYQWKHTTCLSCSVTSLHDDWYVMPGTGP